MDDPPINPGQRILTNEFILTCIQYEYLKDNLKTARSRVQIHRNICEMMVAEEVKSENTAESSGSNSPDSSSARDTTDSDDGEPMAGVIQGRRHSSDEAMSVDNSEEAEPTQLSPEADVKPMVEQMEQVKLDDKEEPKAGPSRETKHGRQESMASSSSEDAAGPVRKRTRAVEKRISERNSDVFEEEEILRSEVYFGNEEDDHVEVSVITMDFLRKTLKALRENTFNLQEPIGKIGGPLSAARSKVYLPLDLYCDYSYQLSDSLGDANFKPLPFDQIKSTIDHGKVKVQLSNSNKIFMNMLKKQVENQGTTKTQRQLQMEEAAKKSGGHVIDEEDVYHTWEPKDGSEDMHIQHWEDPNGTWAWEDHSVRFYKGMMYEDMAANVFTECLAQTINRSDLVDFGIEWKTTWTQEAPHSMDFYRKVKKTMLTNKGECLNIGSFKMKILKKQVKRDFPFKLRFARNLENIQICVWDDGQLGGMDYHGLIQFIGAYPEEWKNAKHLNIADRNLEEFRTDLTSFKTVIVWQLDAQYIKDLIEAFVANPPNPKKVVAVYSKNPYNYDDMKERLETDVFGRLLVPIPNNENSQLRVIIFQTFVSFGLAVKNQSDDSSD